jgi:hypothetical protein
VGPAWQRERKERREGSAGLGRRRRWTGNLGRAGGKEKRGIKREWKGERVIGLGQKVKKREEKKEEAFELKEMHSYSFEFKFKI